ncbi:hypothetical protein [Halobacillus litoralis]|uniref:Uncharacterized protein n=1 Tax=Halobacillus litoralis TaxID=45668 RepID=A0A410MJ69_9BACI|nr:hypothetical protein [Halobacillus litoralis]QAS54751.1 hypothetical protein HLI_21070 [Halobacillus litoralis]
MYVNEISLEKVLLSIDELLKDLEVNNPKYESVFLIMKNPVIDIVAKSLRMQPGYFAQPLYDGKYVTFDVERIKKAREELNQKIGMREEYEH